MEQVVGGHGCSSVPSFDVEKGEREDETDDCSVQKLQASWWTEVGLKQVRPGCPQQPDDSEGYWAVGAQYEQEGVAEEVAHDSTELVEEVDCSGEAGEHILDIWERPAQTALIVHQGPGNIQKGECHG